MPACLSATLDALLAALEPAACIMLARASGSTPRAAGTTMLVTRASHSGTIGGGRLEWEAVLRARAMLEAGAARDTFDMALGPASGQCCGGHVTVVIEAARAEHVAMLRADEQASLANNPHVLIFGAGHIGRALALALAPLPFATRLIDERAPELALLGDVPVATVFTTNTLAQVMQAPPMSAFVVMTHSHALDSLICASVLERGDFAYLGLIGSKTKRARFEHAFAALGLPATHIARLVCPIGGATVRDKRPEVIAALAGAELVQALLAGR